MKPVGKQTLLVILVVVLVILNLGLVTFMWYSQRPDNGPGGPDTAKFLIKELGFDKAQEQQYITLQHRLSDSLSPIRENERHLHDRFFEMMHAASPDSALVASTVDSMGHIRVQIEYLTFNHFRQVRALCNAEQQQKFDKIISDMMRRMGPRPPGPHHGHGDGPPPNGEHGPPDGPPQR
jgi:protein CpxP